MISNISTSPNTLASNLQTLQTTPAENKAQSSKPRMSAEQAQNLASQISNANPADLLKSLDITKLQSNQTFSLMA